MGVEVNVFLEYTAKYVCKAVANYEYNYYTQLAQLCNWTLVAQLGNHLNNLLLRCIAGVCLVRQLRTQRQLPS